MPSFWDNLRFGGGSPTQPGQGYDEAGGAESQDMFIYVSHPLPTAGTSFPSIIVAQEAFGANRHIQKVCDRYAAEGYVAIAPALFHREHPNPQLGYGDEDAPTRNRYMAALRDEEIVDDINQVIRWTQGNQFRRTNGRGVGIVGFCVGGRIGLLGRHQLRRPARGRLLLPRTPPGTLRRRPRAHRQDQQHHDPGHG